MPQLCDFELEFAIFSVQYLSFGLVSHIDPRTTSIAYSRAWQSFPLLVGEIKAKQQESVAMETSEVRKNLTANWGTYFSGHTILPA